jgi:DnaJ-like protein
MKFDSPLFDRIRVKPSEDRRAQTDQPCCDWPNCSSAATHRAPKGRGREREYWRFCLDHVREYNQSYNFFAGMDDDAVARYQKDALTGHLPTWKIGMIGGKGRSANSGNGRRRSRMFEDGCDSDDPFDIMRDFGAARTAHSRAEAERRTIRNAERKALNSLGLEEGAGRHDIKARFKELVKRHHPDLNDGDRGSEDKLREIIEAHSYLKKQGLC